jgi:hypothetical protein
MFQGHGGKSFWGLNAVLIRADGADIYMIEASLTAGIPNVSSVWIN